MVRRWRLGTFAFPPGLAWLLEAMAAVASETYTSTSAPIQYAAVRAFEGGLEIERYLWDARRVLRALGGWCAEQLGVAGVQVAPPQGGFYLFADFSEHAQSLAGRGIGDGRALCERVLEETGVAFLPGVEFGRPAEELTARLAYVDFDGARALAAAERQGDDALDAEFLRSFCPSVVEAIARLCEWLGTDAGLWHTGAREESP